MNNRIRLAVSVYSIPANNSIATSQIKGVSLLIVLIHVYSMDVLVMKSKV